VFVTDLANPAVRLRVPVTLALGNGKGTPTIHPGASALKVSLPPGRTHTIGLSVSDASRACGFPFSADVYGGGWATINHSGDGVYDGVVGSPHNPSTSSDPTKVTIPIVINTSGLRAGHTYRVKVQISSEIAEPQPVFVPITLYVT
jgi:hypothetical protein